MLHHLESVGADAPTYRCTVLEAAVVGLVLQVEVEVHLHHGGACRRCCIRERGEVLGLDLRIVGVQSPGLRPGTSRET